MGFHTQAIVISVRQQVVIRCWKDASCQRCQIREQIPWLERILPTFDASSKLAADTKITATVSRSVDNPHTQCRQSTKTNQKSGTHKSFKHSAVHPPPISMLKIEEGAGAMLLGSIYDKAAGTNGAQLTIKKTLRIDWQRQTSLHRHEKIFFHRQQGGDIDWDTLRTSFQVGIYMDRIKTLRAHGITPWRKKNTKN